jgi:hypothetical protein
MRLSLSGRYVPVLESDQLVVQALDRHFAHDIIGLALIRGVDNAAVGLISQHGVRRGRAVDAIQVFLAGDALVAQVNKSGLDKAHMLAPDTRSEVGGIPDQACLEFGVTEEKARAEGHDAQNGINLPAVL